jgi:hypothetical protein
MSPKLPSNASHALPSTAGMAQHRRPVQPRAITGIAERILAGARETANREIEYANG